MFVHSEVRGGDREEGGGKREEGRGKRREGRGGGFLLFILFELKKERQKEKENSKAV